MFKNNVRLPLLSMAFSSFAPIHHMAPLVMALQSIHGYRIIFLLNQSQKLKLLEYDKFNHLTTYFFINFYQNNDLDESGSYRTSPRTSSQLTWLVQSRFKNNVRLPLLSMAFLSFAPIYHMAPLAMALQSMYRIIFLLNQSQKLKLLEYNKFNHLTTYF